ncbi:MAG: HAD-IIA family hydrolase [Rhodospirillales bacterium]
MRQTIDAKWVFDRYGQVRQRLPFPHFSPATEPVANLGDIADRFDTFVFDSFGVLNVGNAAIPGAVERVSQLRDAGKRVFVLTNAASVPIRRLQQKYAGLGFDFSASEIVSSRAVLMHALRQFDAGMEWAVIAPDDAEIDELPARVRHYTDSTKGHCDGFIFLSSSGWNEHRQDILRRALERKARPLLIGNPDLVAPREDCLTLEPGAYAHDIADRSSVAPVFFGKPFGNAFEFLVDVSGDTLNPERTLMIGDTLHTDVLGGRAAGMHTALVTEFGVLRDLEPAACIAASGIVPDFRMPSI